MPELEALLQNNGLRPRKHAESRQNEAASNGNRLESAYRISTDEKDILMHKTSITCAALGAVLLSAQAQAGWTALTNQPPVRVSDLFLLMDGRILVNENDASGFATVRWWTLTPSPTGSYKDGTWAQVGSQTFTHLYYGSGIFKDGRVMCCGGEYSTGGSETNKTEIFNPLTNTWTVVPGPTGWANVGDAPACILEDGRFFVGSIFDNRSAIYDPVTGLWSAAAPSLNARQTEETFVLLPDNSVLKWNCIGHPGSGRYLSSSNSWVNCGNTPVDLVLPGSLETGAGILLPNGKTFCIGGPPTTCLYTMPSVPTQPGTWTAGPNQPNINGLPMGCEDAPAAMLPNGNVLMAVGRVSANGGNFYAPTFFTEYDGTTIAQVTTAPNSSGPPYVGRMVNLPTGEVLFTAGTQAAYIYTNGGGPNPAWKPVVTDLLPAIEKGTQNVLKGLQLNGVSNGCSYGDEYNNATNYPIVRATGTTGLVTTCRTFNHSTMGVQTGNNVVSTNVDVPSTMTSGMYGVTVSAAGIMSDPVNILIGTGFESLTYSIFRGQLAGGSLADAQTSNDQYLSVQKGIVVNASEAPVQVIFNTTSNTLVPNGIGLQLEAGVNTVGLSQKIEFFNYSTNQFDVVKTTNATTADSLVAAVIPTNASNYVNSTNGNVQVKVSYSQVGPVANSAWTARFDKVRFIIGG